MSRPAGTRPPCYLSFPELATPAQVEALEQLAVAQGLAPVHVPRSLPVDAHLSIVRVVANHSGGRLLELLDDRGERSDTVQRSVSVAWAAIAQRVTGETARVQAGSWRRLRTAFAVHGIDAVWKAASHRPRAWEETPAELAARCDVLPDLPRADPPARSTLLALADWLRATAARLQAWRVRGAS